MTDTYNPDGKYTVVRKYAKGHPDVIVDTGLTLTEARMHCADPETSSRTAYGPGKQEHTSKFGPWFDSYYKEDAQ